MNVILGNEVLLSCILPSHLTELVSITAWVDSEGNSFTSRHGLGNFSLHSAVQTANWTALNSILFRAFQLAVVS